MWLFGLVIFVKNVEGLVEPIITPNLETTDAIVVLTGGSDRLLTGIELLKASKGKKLFISGVHHGLGLDRVLSAQPVPTDLRDCCIVLGRAESTHGNADETLIWITAEHYHSLRLVTANYHMQRSLLLFHAAMPNIKIIPHPVMPESVKLDNWWNRTGTANLLVTEYNKLLWAWARTEMGL